MQRLPIHSLSLFTGAFAVLAGAGLVYKARAFRASLIAFGRHAAASLRPVSAVLGMLAICGSICGSMATAQTAHFTAAQNILNLPSGLNFPYGVAVDGSGNIYVADTYHGRVLKETPSAGGYVESIVASLLAYPYGVAVDLNGNVYIADDGLAQVLMETPSAGSYVQTMIGSGMSGPTGVAVDTNGNVYVADTGNTRVLMETLSAGSYTQSVIPTLGLTGVQGIAVDSSFNVYVADGYNPQVVKETPSEGSYTQSTVASGGGPIGVAVDASGNVYIANYTYGNVLKETPSGNSYIASTVPTEGSFYPSGIAVDAGGDVFFTDINGYKMVEVSQSGGNFGIVNVASASPNAVSLFFIFDSAGTLGSTTVLTQGTTGLDYTDAGTGSCHAATDYSPGDICTVDVAFTPAFPAARLGAAELLNGSGQAIANGYVQGTGSGPQLSFQTAGGLGTFLPGSQSILGSGFSEPGGVAMDGAGNVFVADFGNNAVKEVLAAGSFTTINTLPASGLSAPAAVALDGSGNLFVADSGDNAVKEILAAGGYTTVNTLGTGFNFPLAVAVDGSGNVFVADSGHNAVKEILAVGEYTTINTLGSGFNFPQGVAVDGSGNVFVGDTGHNAVKEILAAGGYATVNTLGSGFNGPCGVAVDGAGDVFVADSNNNVVKEILAAGGYATVNTLGTGFNGIQGVTVDERGNIFVADIGDNLVSQLNYAVAPTLTFATATTEGTTDTTDGPQTVTLANIGNAALTFPAPVSGNNPSIAANFTLNSSVESACPLVNSVSSAGTLASGAFCLLPISFTPAAVGALSGSLVLTDTALNAAAPGYAVQSIMLSGTATPPVPVLAALTTPTPNAGTMLGTSNVSFGWSAGSGVTYYMLSLGTSGPGASDLYLSGWTTSTSVAVPTLPSNGVTVYARLYSRISGIWQSADYTYTESGSPTPAALTTPIPNAGTELGTSNVSFGWSAGSAVTYYMLSLGTTGPGSSDLYQSGWTNATSATAPSLPSNGVTVYARLYSRISGVWQSADYTYTESGSPAQAVLTTPMPGLGTVLGSSSATFGWTAGSGVTYYMLSLGTSGPGASDLYLSGWTTSTSVVVPSLPTNGVTVYARLYSRISGVWRSADYVYTAQ